METDPTTDPDAESPEVRLRERLEEIRARSVKSTSWRETTQYLSRLVNRAGYVPVHTRLSRGDLAFLAGARDEVAALADLGIPLPDLHRPQESGGLSSDPAYRIRRCRTCMGRWPCPTLRVISETLTR